MTDKKNIYQKLVEVRKNINSFKKDSDGYNFKYVSGTQVLSQIKKDLDIQGIILESHLTYPTAKKSDRGYLVSSPMKMIWVDVDNPKDRIEIDWFMVGEQKDPSQSFGSGLTYTERYFLLKFFNIPTDEDDPDGLKKKGNNKKPTTPKPTTPKPKDKDLELKKQPHEKQELNSETFKMLGGKYEGKTLNECPSWFLEGQIKWVTDGKSDPAKYGYDKDEYIGMFKSALAYRKEKKEAEDIEKEFDKQEELE